MSRKLSEALLTGIDRQHEVEAVVKQVALTNHDRHVVFRDVGARLGLLSQKTVRDAFLSMWVDEFKDEADGLILKIDGFLPKLNEDDG